MPSYAAAAISQSLVLREFGPPESALSLEPQELPPLGERLATIQRRIQKVAQSIIKLQKIAKKSSQYTMH
jgi:hypothetical protein